MAENGDNEIPPAVDETPEKETVETETTEPATTEQQEDEPEYIEDPILKEEEMKKLFVGGITTDSTDDELKEFFEQMSGGIVEDHVIIRKDTDKKSHFGFITFATSELVDEVLLKRDQLKFKDRQLDVNRAVPKNITTPGAHEKTKKLFIANLPKLDCTEDDLKKYFNQRHKKQYGTIESIQLIKRKDEHGNNLPENKGFGFINVSSEDLADKMAIQHATFEFKGRRIELKKSVPTAANRYNKRGGRGGGANQHSYGYGGGFGYSGGYAGGWAGYDQGFGGQGYAGYGPGYDYYSNYGGAPRGGGGGGRGGRYKPY